MPLTLAELAGLPSPFYRVGVKAIIRDATQRVLVLNNEDGRHEIPGGGWEHGETLEAALQRELQEEIGVQAKAISSVQFVYRGQSDYGWHTLRLAVNVELQGTQFVPADGMVSTRFVTKEQFLRLDFRYTEMGILDHIDEIWPQQSTVLPRPLL